MTADELANLGYQPGQTGSVDINAAQSAVTPQDLQKFYAMAGNSNAGAPDISQVNTQPTYIDSTLLNAVAIPNSDPNGFISNQPSQVTGPDGVAMMLPPNTGAANTYGGQAAPDQPTQSTTQSATQQNQLPGVDFYAWAKQNYGLERGQQITVQEKLKLLELHNDYQKELLKQQDPEKLSAIRKAAIDVQKSEIELSKSKTEQSDAIAKKEDAIPQVQENIKLLDELVTHKGLPASVGAKGAEFLFGLKSEPMAGTDAANFMERVKQVQGKNFLTAFNQLRGAGQITEIEGAKAQAALGRLGTSQSEGAFKESVNELRDILQAGLDRSKARLASIAPQALTSTPSGLPEAPSPSSASASAGSPQLRTVGGKTYQLNPATGGWRPVN